jgi:hypothetical protein
VLSTYVIYSFATQEVAVEPTHQEPIQKND